MATDLQFCPHCGAAVTADDQTCPQCQTDLRPFRTADQGQAVAQPKKPKLSLNALSANPYREGMKRLKEQQRGDQPATPKHRWHWPWSKG
ncbi:MAG TPA: hypothetical protein H9875_05015 [Candidatus Levilactobacillus faecigallinarum]|uniref:Putative zinc-ribbon domain-containing protein n=1 Tax=Candidatus Levilactobacillus faecigallinarum TaxID=2838638 RepID=A0A9D1QRF9_9LACO|nr:hypothetical protein [Candidatus Levilactobacillus faecigallinarum]